MKGLLLASCAIFYHTAFADTCIPREFAAEDVSANYEKITAEESAKLAAAQKDFAELMQEVRKKKDSSNQVELLNAFVDAAGMVFVLHGAMNVQTVIREDEQKRKQQDKLYKQKDKLYEQMHAATDRSEITKYKQELERLSDEIIRLEDEFKRLVSEKGLDMDNTRGGLATSKEGLKMSVEEAFASAKDGGGNKLKALLKRRVEVFKAWIDDLKAIPSWGGKVKETLFFSMKKIGFVSMVMMVPLGAYIWMSRLKEEQRMTALTSEQDKVMNQMMMFDLLSSQKSFAELAATRAKLLPQRVCPPTT